MKHEISILLNGVKTSFYITPTQSLLSLLREDAHLTGAKCGCNAGDCGACTVLLDDKAVKACIVPAIIADGRKVTTVEGLAVDGKLNPLQQAFYENSAPQCGYCTPGILMAAQGLLNKHPNANRHQIVEALSGNLCRCTGYYKYIESVEDVVAGKFSDGEAAK